MRFFVEGDRVFRIANIPAGWSPAAGQGQSSYVKGGRKPSDPIFSINVLTLPRTAL